MNPRNCPLDTTDFGLVRRFLESMPLDELIFQTEQMFNQLSSSEKITYDICRYCTDYADIDGRIMFVEALFSNAVFSSVYVPLSYQRSPRLIDLVRTKKYEYYIPIAHELAQEAAALTDEMEAAPASAITVTNPRWNHADEQRKADSPTVAAVGDSVELLVDVKGYPEGAPVTFDIFDASKDPAMRIDTVRGKNEGGVAKVSWTVADPNERGKDLKLEFEGSARSKSSGKAPIDITSDIYRVEVVDDEGNKLEGVKVEFTVPGKDPVVVPTDANGIAEQPAEDPAVEADVRILWEMTGEDGTVETGSEEGNVAEGSDAPVNVVNPENATETPTEGYEIFVVDEKENPIEGAQVSFMVDEKESVVTTDGKGRAFLPKQGSSTSTATVKIALATVSDNPETDSSQVSGGTGDAIAATGVSSDSGTGETPVISDTAAADSTGIATATTDTSTADDTGDDGVVKEIIVTSSAFSKGGTIPDEYTMDGGNDSPQLNWKTDAAGIKSFVLICVDVSADYYHWLCYDIPPTTNMLARNASRTSSSTLIQGVGNDGSGYTGPHPPYGDPEHEYQLLVHALDTKLNLAAGADPQTVQQAMQGHVVAEGKLVGLYGR